MPHFDGHAKNCLRLNWQKKTEHQQQGDEYRVKQHLHENPPNPSSKHEHSNKE